MKISAYPFLQQEGQAPRAGEKNNTKPASRRSLSLSGEESCSRSNGISEMLRTRMRAHLAQVHVAQEELSSLQKNEKHLVEAEKLYQQIGKLLQQQGSEEKTEKMDLLYRHLGKVRDMLAKLKPDNTSTDNSHTGVVTKTEDVDSRQYDDLENDMANYSAELEEQRQKLTGRKMELVAAIAHNLVAVENITASSSVIRDNDYAQRVMTEVKETLAKNQHSFTLTLMNRQNIAALLR